MSRKDLLQHPAGALRRARRRASHFRTEAPDVDALARELRPGGRRRRRELRGPHQVRRRLRPDARRAPQQVHVARHRPGVRGVQVLHLRDPVRRHAGARLPVRRRAAARSSSRCTTTSGARAGFDASAGRGVPARGQRRGVDRADRASCSPTCSTATRILANNSKWLNFTTVTQPHAGGTATSCCSATPRTPRTSRSARAPSWRWRTRWRWPPACTSSPTSPTALAAYEAERRPVVLSTQRAAQASLEWFENIGQYVGPGRRSSSRSTSSPAAAGSPTTTCGCATRSSSPAMDALVRRREAGDRRRSRAADVPAVPARGLELGNRVVVSPMDMYSADDGVPTDFHLVHLGAQGARRRRAGDDRDGLRLAGRPDHARAAPASTPTSRRRPGRGSSTSCTRRARRRIGLQLGHSGRKGSTKLMWEGIDEPLPDGQLGGRRAVARCRTRRRNQVPRELTRAELDAITGRVRRLRRGRRPGPASTCSSCTARTATCSRRSSRR